MIENRIDFKTFVESFHESVFYDAVSELEDNDILLEGQFPFLNDATMRSRNFDIIKKILERYGYQNVDKHQCIAVEVEELGWMHCFFIFGNRFETTKYVRKVAIPYFTNKHGDMNSDL